MAMLIFSNYFEYPQFDSDKFKQTTTETGDGTIKETIIGANLLINVSQVFVNS